MGDRIRVQLLVREIYISLINHPGKLSLAIPPWVGAMSTGQRAMMLCDWEYRQIWCCLQVTLCDPYLSSFGAFARRLAIQIHVYFTLLYFIHRQLWKPLSVSIFHFIVSTCRFAQLCTSGGARPGRARSNDLAERLPPWVSLQRGRIACNAERCYTYSNSVCLSVRLPHAGTLSRRIKIESRGLHCEVAKTL